MKLETAISPPPLAQQRPGQTNRWRRLWQRFSAARRDAAAGRVRRVILLLAMLSLINAFDLIFTLEATKVGPFVELNPIAAAFVQTAGALVAFKVSMVLLGFGIFFCFRRHFLTELACWGLCGVYAVLAGRWWVYYFLVHD